MKLKLVKGGPGSGRKPGSGTRVPAGGIRLPSKPYRSGVRPSEAFPNGRKPGGDTRPSPIPSHNDPKPAPKK